MWRGTRRQAGTRWRPGTPRGWRRGHGRRPTLESPCQVHGRLDVLGIAHLHIHPNVLGKAPDEEIGLLFGRDATCMAGHRLKAVGELLDSRLEWQAPQLRQPSTANWRSEALAAQLDEALPRRHALILLEGVVPGLRQAPEVVRRNPRSVGGRPSLAPEELLAVVEPIQGVFRAVVRCELEAMRLGRQAVETAPHGLLRALVGTLLVGPRWHGRVGRHRGAGVVEQRPVHAAVQGPCCIGSPMGDRRWSLRDGGSRRRRGV